MAKRKRRLARRIWFTLATLFLIGMTTAAMCAVTFAIYINKYIIPTCDIDLDNYGLDFTSFVYYTDTETGQIKELEKLHDTENRVWVGFENIPENLKKAFICIEDSRFEQHHGVDWKRTIGATLSWTGLVKFTGGGSTITQQLIKNVTGEDQTTVKRKVQEIFRALELERRYTKDQILEMYLNTIFLGENYNGVQTAAQGYFGKDVSELSLAECASIAAITKYPYKFDPYRNPEKNKERQEVILNEMCKQGKITEAERDEAKAVELKFAGKGLSGSAQNKEVQSYFVDQVIEDVISDLMKQKGYSKKMATTLLYTGGLKIYATIDKDIQAKMDKIFTNENNFPSIKGTDGSLPQAAMVITDPYTGNVVAMVGGRGEKQGARVLNRATQSYRSPGSAIKPLAVYAPALELGYITPASAMDDVPIDFNVNKNGWPKNYLTNSANPNGSRYYGRMTIVRAVEISNNTIPAQLIQAITPEVAYDYLTYKFGISTLVKSEKTSSGKVVSDIAGPAALSLGGLTKGASVLEINSAYCTFVNEGIYIKPRTYTKVVDSSGTILLDNSQTIVADALSTKTAASMLCLLEDVVTGSSGTGRAAKIKGIATAGKTGTTTDDKDRWFVGMTPYYVATVWFGYDQQQTIKNVSGNPALKLWKAVMDLVHEDLPNKSFDKPKNFVTVNYCADSGCLATDFCKSDPRGSRVVSFQMAAEDKPTEYCTMHVGVTVCTDSDCIANEYCPNTKVVGLLNITRAFAISGIHVEDQQYTVSFDKDGSIISAEQALAGTGKYPALPSLANGKTAYNSICTNHTQSAEQPSTEETAASENIPSQLPTIDSVETLPTESQINIITEPTENITELPSESPIPIDTIPLEETEETDVIVNPTVPSPIDPSPIIN